MKLNMFKLLMVNVFLLVCISGCFGPDISGDEGTGSEEDETASGGTGTGGSGTGSGGTSTATSTSAVSETCSRTAGHNVYYIGSTVSLQYTCGNTVSSVEDSGTPSFLTSSTSASAVTFSSTTAPSTTSDTSWSFGVNGNTTTGDAASISTKVLTNTTLAAEMDTTLSMSTNYNTELSFALTADLDATWDGVASDVNFDIASIATDMQGLLLSTEADVACPASGTNYVCQDSPTSSSNSFDADAKIKWKFSAFDQGTYYLTLNPTLEIEDGANTLASKTLTFTIPIQTAGNVTVTDSATEGATIEAAEFDKRHYYYGLAVNSLNSPTGPHVGILYSLSTGVYDTYFRELTIDRTDDAGDAGDDGVATTARLLESGGNNSSSFVIRSLPDTNPSDANGGDWITLGARVNGTATNLYYNKVAYGAPANSVTAELTSYAASNSASAIDMSKPFNDSGTTRVGVSFVKIDNTGVYHLIVTKLNPAGTNAGTIIDDANFEIGTPADCDLVNGAPHNMNLTKIRQTAESGTNYFYVAYRDQTNIDVLKVAAQNGGSCTATPATLVAGVLANSDTSASWQTLDMALGTINGQTVVGVVYKDPANNQYCYFKRFNQTLTTAGDTLALTTDRCYNPSIHFNSKSGKFIVTMAQRDAGLTWDLIAKEVTIGTGTTDTAASLAEIKSDLANFPVKMATDYFADGDWMAVLYRVRSTSPIIIHGYHVPGR